MCVKEKRVACIGNYLLIRNTGSNSSSRFSELGKVSKKLYGLGVRKKLFFLAR